MNGCPKCGSLSRYADHCGVWCGNENCRHLIERAYEKDQRIAELEAELAELRKDKARLDWLGASRVSPVWHFSSLDGSDGWGCTFVDGYAWGRGQTVRDAIDDVMSQVKG